MVSGAQGVDDPVYEMPNMKDEEFSDPDPIEIPIDGNLDLHTFSPRDVDELLPEYLRVCRERGIFSVRVIHGKGTGVLRERVASILRRLPEVASFRTAGEDAGGWGATLVELHRRA